MALLRNLLYVAPAMVALRALILLLLLADLRAHAQWSEPITCRMHRGRYVMPATVNDGTTNFHFMLDTACTIPTLHPNFAKELAIQSSGSVRIVGIAGEERAPTFRGLSFKAAGFTYSPRRVASLASEESHSRRRSDGVLGSGFFERFVVEFNPATKSVRLHEPTNFIYEGNGKIIPFHIRKETPVVKASLSFEPGKSTNVLEAEFEIDTGCDSGICVGSHYVKEHKLLDKGKTEGDQKFGIGGDVDTYNGKIPLLKLADFEAKNVQTDFFKDGSPVDPPLAGHIGMGVLGKRKVIFDYGRKRIIIEN